MVMQNYLYVLNYDSISKHFLLYLILMGLVLFFFSGTSGEFGLDMFRTECQSGYKVFLQL